jgi:multidrug efflux pump subunit AcrB
MAQLGVTPADVANAIRTQNQQYAAGKIGQDPAPNGQSLVYTVTTRGRLLEPEEFGNIILRASGPGGVLRVRDVATVELGAQSYEAIASVDGKPTIAIAVFLQSGANALDVAAGVKARMEELKRGFPEGINYFIPFDTTRFVQASIREVIITLAEAAVLVLLVVFIFLQSWRATLIPFVAVPVSLIGAFGGLYLFGFSINTLTLFAIVLATGIVVDDAIVVLENVERLMAERKLSPKEASIESMREVTGAIVAIELVLAAVFIPVAFLGGIAGKLYQQFAVTVVTAVTISGITALTLTPALCALLLKPQHTEHGIFRPFNKGFAWLTRRYQGSAACGSIARSVVRCCSSRRHRARRAAVPRGAVGLRAAGGPGLSHRRVILPDGATLQRTGASATSCSADRQNPRGRARVLVTRLRLIGGGNKTNAATIFLPLKPWEERDDRGEQSRSSCSARAPACRRASCSRSIRRRSAASAPRAASRSTCRIARTRDPRSSRSSSAASPTPCASVASSRASLLLPPHGAAALRRRRRGEGHGARGAGQHDLRRAAGDDGAVVRQRLQPLRTHVPRADPGRGAVSRSARGHRNIYVRSTTTNPCCPSRRSSASSAWSARKQIDRYNGFIAAKVIGNGAPGVSSGQAIGVVEEVAAATLPAGYTIEWTGQAFQEKRIGTTAIFAFVFAIVMVFLILSANYERWALPVAVLLAVPFGLLGALVFVFLRGFSNDIYFQIGLLVLIGLAAKNAILIVEFAAQKQADGMPAGEAAIEASRLRFRPIVMTSLAFILGTMPLVIATGAGAASRQSMGTGVVGGMIVATFIATLFIPMFYMLLARRHRRAPAAALPPMPEEEPT